ncbi:hypothetical protein FACS1894172_02950 [Spirochaetia bacterium]|nr:hypothetical protein FACS1894172_02950 [Spirochaetia bacterium]
MLEEEEKNRIGGKMTELFNQGNGFMLPTSGIRPPKIGYHYYWCRKCGNHFEGLLPICPKCKSLTVTQDTIVRH